MHPLEHKGETELSVALGPAYARPVTWTWGGEALTNAIIFSHILVIVLLNAARFSDLRQREQDRVQNASLPLTKTSPDQSSAQSLGF